MLTRPKAQCSCGECHTKLSGCAPCSGCVPTNLCLTILTNDSCCPFTTATYVYQNLSWSLLDPDSVNWCGGIEGATITLEEIAGECYFVVRVKYAYLDDLVEVASENIKTTDFSVTVEPDEYVLASSFSVFPKAGQANPNIYFECGSCLDGCSCLPNELCITYITESDCAPSRFKEITAWDGCSGYDPVTFSFSKLDGSVETREVQITLGEPPICGLTVSVISNSYDTVEYNVPLTSPGKFCSVNVQETIKDDPDVLGLETLKIVDDCLCLPLDSEECPLACSELKSECILESVIMSIIANNCESLDGITRSNGDSEPTGNPLDPEPEEYPRCPSQAWHWEFTIDSECDFEHTHPSNIPHDHNYPYVISARLYYPLLSCDDAPDDSLIADPTRYILQWSVQANPCGTTWTGYAFPDPDTASCSPLFLEYVMEPSGGDVSPCYGLCCQEQLIIRITQ